MLHSWRCVRACQDTVSGGTGSLVRVRGRALGRTYEVVFLGADGAADDVAAAPIRRKRNVVDVRVPLGAAPGPLLVAHHDGQQSLPSATALAIVPEATLKSTGETPTVEVQVQSRRAFFDAELPARVSYVLHADSPATVVVELVRASDGARGHELGRGRGRARDAACAELGRHGGRPAPEARPLRLPRQRRRLRRRAGGARAGAAGPGSGADPVPRARVPVRGPHYFGEFAARFGGGRGHQGQDTFAACGTPLVAARGGVVKFKQYHGAAGHYLVIDGERTGIDYTYMHLRDAALVDEGDRVRTGQLIGYVGQTGRASGCHLHFEMWKRAGLVRRRQPVRSAAVSAGLGQDLLTAQHTPF